MALAKVGDYVAEARRILQDTHEVQRYTDDDLKAALGLGAYEILRLRPDVFLMTLTASPIDITAGSDDNAAVNVDARYRMCLVYFMSGQALLREDEAGAESKAGTLIALAKQQLGQNA